MKIPALQPNVVIPLAISLNERGVAGFANSITNGIDQLKINSFYEPVKNAFTGQATLYVVKRPGVTIDNNAYGTSNHTGYLVQRAPSLGSAWIFSNISTSTIASDSQVTTHITTFSNLLGGTRPCYSDHTNISGVENLVLQLRNGSLVQSVFYSQDISSFIKITTSNFTDINILGKMEFMDGYAFGMNSSNRIYNSVLNSLSSWAATDYFTKQIRQDAAAGLARRGSQILAFGYETVEVLFNAGYPSGSPLETIKHLAGNYGIFPQLSNKMGHYYTNLGSRLYFFGRTAVNGGAGVFAYDGSGFSKVSHGAVDKILLSNDLSTVYSVDRVRFGGKTAVSFALDQVSSTTQRWLLYFPEWNDWFQWNSTIFSPVNAWGYHLGLGTSSHRLYQFLFGDKWQDDTTNYTMTHQFKLPSKTNQWQTMPMCGLRADTSRSAQNLNIEFSDDDYQTWQTLRTIDLTTPDKQITRCGAWRGQRAVRLTSDPGNLEVRLEMFMARIE